VKSRLFALEMLAPKWSLLDTLALKAGHFVGRERAAPG